MKASSNRQHKTLASVATQQAAFTNDTLKRMDRSCSRLARNTKQANIKLDELSTQVQHSSRHTRQTIDAMIARMTGIHARTTFSASSIDTITRLFREEIRSIVTRLVGEISDHKESHREEALRRPGNLNDAIIRGIGSDLSAQRTFEASDWFTLHTANLNECIARRKHKQMECEPNVAQQLSTNQESSSPHYTISNFKRTWSHYSRFGRLEIKVTYTNHRINGSPQSRNYTSVKVHFWPSQKYLNLPRLSAFYSTAPTTEGYKQLAPTITLHPVLANDHLAFSVMESGDLATLQNMLASRQIHLRSCDRSGATILHIRTSCLLQSIHVSLKWIFGPKLDQILHRFPPISIYITNHSHSLLFRFV